MSENPIMNIGDLAKPATALIEKVSDAMGGIFKPYQMVRVAKAEAEVERIKVQSEIELSDLGRRALYRFLQEESQRQSNIEGIIHKAISNLSEDSSPEEIEDDWIANYFEKSRIVSDDDMQMLWAKLLAGEANAPTSFSRKTVNLLADMDKRDAELFSHLCDFGWIIEFSDQLVPLIFDYRADIFSHHGLNYDTFSHLEALGLAKIDTNGTFVLGPMPSTFFISYFGSRVELKLPVGSEPNLQIGNVLLTQFGRELARLCETSPVDEFFELTCSRWQDESLVFTPDGA